MKGSVNSQTAKTCNKFLTGQEWGTNVLVSYGFMENPHDWGALKVLLRLTLGKTVRNMLFDVV